MGRGSGMEIAITPMEPGTYGVQVTEGTVCTSHRVRVPDAMLEDLAIADVDHEVLVRESFAFLLEREPASAILGEFALDDIARFFPDYYDELRERIGTTA